MRLLPAAFPQVGRTAARHVAATAGTIDGLYQQVARQVRGVSRKRPGKSPRTDGHASRRRCGARRNGLLRSDLKIPYHNDSGPITAIERAVRPAGVQLPDGPEKVDGCPIAARQASDLSMQNALMPRVDKANHRIHRSTA